MRRESLHLRLGAHPSPCSPWSIHQGQATRVSNTSPDTPGVRSPRVPEEGGYIPDSSRRDERGCNGHALSALSVFRPVCIWTTVFSLAVPSFLRRPPPSSRLPRRFPPTSFVINAKHRSFGLLPESRPPLYVQNAPPPLAQHPPFRVSSISLSLSRA